MSSPSYLESGFSFASFALWLLVVPYRRRGHSCRMSLPGHPLVPCGPGKCSIGAVAPLLAFSSPSRGKLPKPSFLNFPGFFLAEISAWCRTELTFIHLSLRMSPWCHLIKAAVVEWRCWAVGCRGRSRRRRQGAQVLSSPPALAVGVLSPRRGALTARSILAWMDRGLEGLKWG